MQQAEQRQARAAPADGQPEAAHALALADERGADGDQGDGHDEPAEAGEPPDDGLDATPERTGQIEVDRQAEQHADGDEADPGELVLATLDGLAKLGRRLVRAATWSEAQRPAPALPALASAVVVVFDRFLG